MGNKKGKTAAQQHIQQSMGHMVSQAALAKMGPAIEQYVQQVVRNLGSQLAAQQAGTLETLFTRVVVLEDIIMEKLGYSKDDLSTKVSEAEDKKENLTLVDGAVELNDVVRLEISTKSQDQTEYQGTSRLKVYQTGSNKTLGNELEPEILGMKAGDTAEVKFGKDKSMLAKIKIDRVSRPPKPVALTSAPAAEPTPEGQDANQSQG